MYSESELVTIARRENNNKRNYLVINKLQGKHIPTAPSKALKMFYELAKLVKKEYLKERLLIIGFAETATAVGATLAVCTDSLYMQTTRENVEGADYLYFTESHSHATEQRLVRDSFESALDRVDRIVFAEDEITTGNTILNIVNLIKKEFHGKFSFSAASIINSMDKAAENIYKEQNISCHYLLKTNHEMYGLWAESFKINGGYMGVIKDLEGMEWKKDIFELQAGGYQDARCITKGEVYQNACEKLWRQIKTEFFRNPFKIDKTEKLKKNAEEILASVNPAESNRISNTNKSGKILALGTEEFMYPALYAAFKMEEMGYDVKFHATTRSPIIVSDSCSYPLHEKFELRSLYDKDRVTYIYQLDKYDKVFIITDAKKGQTDGISSLVNALKSCGNTNISIVRWCRE